MRARHHATPWRILAFAAALPGRPLDAVFVAVQEDEAAATVGGAGLLAVVPGPADQHLSQKRTVGVRSIAADSARSEVRGRPTLDPSLQRPPPLGLNASVAFVLKTYGELTPWVRGLAARYHAQLSGTAVQVALLRDITSLPSDNGSVSVSSLGLLDGGELPLCEVSWKAAQAEFGEATLRGFKPTAEGPPFGLGGGAHTPFEVLWWRHCAPRLCRSGVDYVWFVEHDAFFNGNVSSFLSTFAEEDADLISGGFRIAGHFWWQYPSFLGGFSKGLRTFSHTDRVVRNVSPLPPLGAVPNVVNKSALPCFTRAPGNLKGLIFRQDVVDRFSARLLWMLDLAISHGILGAAEALAPTLCASGLGLRRGTPCSMLDFAPVLQRKDGSTFASPLFCWPNDVLRQADLFDPFLVQYVGVQCSPQWQNKWLHPVKREEAGGLECRPQAT